MSYLSKIRGIRLTNRILAAALRKGRELPYDLIERLFGTLTVSNPEEPLQVVKPVTNLQDINDQVEAIKEDHDTLFDVSKQFMNELVTRTVASEVVRGAASTKKRELDKVLQRLSLLGADSSISDVVSFDLTNSKYINQNTTTARIDRKSGEVTLKLSNSGTRRHRLNYITSPYRITFSDNSVVEFPITSSPFSSILSDGNNSWLFGASRKNNGSLVCNVDIKVSKDGIPIEINKITCNLPMGCFVSVYISPDDIQWIPVGESKKNVSDVLTWHIPSTFVSYIRIQIDKPTFDSQNGPNYLYTFGIESLGLYSIGYESSSVYETVGFDLDVPINQVVLEADAELSEGSSIKFYVNDHPIASSNLYTGDAESPKVVNLSDPNTVSVDIIAEQANEDYTFSYINGDGESTIICDGIGKRADLDAFDMHSNFSEKIHTNRIWLIENSSIGIDSAAVIKSPILFVGIDGWERKAHTDRVEKRLSNVYLECGQGASAQVYEQVTDQVPLSDVDTTSVSLSRNVLSSTFAIVKPPVNGESVFSKVVSIKHIKPASIFNNVRYVPRPSSLTNLGFNIPGEAAGYFEIDATDTSLFITGGGSSVTNMRVSGLGSVTVALISSTPKRAYIYGSVGAENTLPVPGVSYTLTLAEEDITQKALSADNNTITLSEGVSGGSLLVTYNSPLNSNSSIVAGSLEVYNSQGVLGSLGLDYRLINKQIVVPADSRFPTSTGASGLTVVPLRLSCTVVSDVPGLEVFSTWVTINGVEPKSFTYSALTFGDGESVKIVGEGSSLSLGKAGTVQLQPGAYQIVIQTRPFEIVQSGAVNTAFYKVLTLKDSNNQYFMDMFDTMVAKIDPCRKVGYFEISRSIPQYDNTVFGMDSENNLYLNFNPSMDRRILTMSPSDAETLVGTTNNLPKIKYKLEYLLTTVVNEESLVIKAELNRSGVSDGGVTPVLKNIRLKVA